MKPFTIEIPEARLEDIRRRVADYDWDQLPDAGGWSAGVGLADLKRLVRYWQQTYDWRRVEGRLNKLPHFLTEIQGETLHLVHAKGSGSKPPILLLHGWPGSFVEFEEFLEPLSADGHDVVVPSLPGFAFSKPIMGPIGPRRAAELMHVLMDKLFGNQRFIVQGGDWGQGIAGWMAYLRPERMLGIHINMVDLLTKDVAATTDEESEYLSRRAAILAEETGYSHQQETRPQSLGVAMADSPVGAAGWILEKFGKWSDLHTKADGSPDLWSKYSEERLLTNIMLYIAPSSVVTATWIYHGKHLEGSAAFPAGTSIDVPTGVAAFPDPVFRPPPQSLAEKTYKVVQWTDMKAGGHFAAMEQPELLLAELRAFISLVSEANP